MKIWEHFLKNVDLFFPNVAQGLEAFVSGTEIFFRK